MTKTEASDYSWIAVLGLTLAIVSAILGFAFSQAGDDEAVRGLLWGATAGAGMGGLATGLLARRASRLIGWAVSPAGTLGSPVLLSGLISGEVPEILVPVLVVVLVAGAATEVARLTSMRPFRST
jgi:hypothetical protein